MARCTWLSLWLTNNKMVLLRTFLLAATTESRAIVAVSAVLCLLYLFHFELEFCARLTADGNGLGK